MALKFNCQPSKALKMNSHWFKTNLKTFKMTLGEAYTTITEPVA